MIKIECLCTEFIIESLQLFDSGILLSAPLTALPCLTLSIIISYPGGSEAKSLPANAGDLDSIPGSGRCPGEQPTPVFLPGKSNGQRSLAGYIQSMESQESVTT